MVFELNSSNPPWRSTRNFKEEANAHSSWNQLAEQDTGGRDALNFHQAGSDTAAQEYEQAARDEVLVAVAHSTERSRAKMLAIMGALERRAEQSWATHEKIIEEICSVRQILNLFKDFVDKVMDIVKNISDKFNTIQEMFEMKFKIGNLPVEKNLKN